MNKLSGMVTKAEVMDDTLRNGDVAVVIAALNEASVIADVVSGLGCSFPLLIVVDDGSTDGTSSVAQEAGARVIRHATNLGQGAALGTGIVAALRIPTVEWIVTFDADGQHRPEDAQALVDRAHAGDVEVVLGTRFFQGAELEASRSKQVLLRLATQYTRIQSKLPVTDTHNGLRAMSRGFLEPFEWRQRGMGHASEIIDEVARSGARWAEIPVHVQYSDYSRAKGQPMINSVNLLFDSLFR